MKDDLRPPQFLSVIIPTYNRRGSLLQTLDSVATQSCPSECFEVVVVDDGGSDGTAELAHESFPFTFSLYRQENQGSGAARNHGAIRSDGSVLVFIDDDMTLSPDYLSKVTAVVMPGTLAMGLIQPYEHPSGSCFSIVEAGRIQEQAVATTQDQEVPYTECTSNNLAVHRSDFMDVGMWEDVLGDGPTLWGDVEFGYRAYQHGCRFLRVADAGILHRDQHVRDLGAATRRAYHVSRIVQPLFKLHPEIKSHLPMFHDKGPILWGEDSLSLILRKMVRQVASSRPTAWAMQQVILCLECQMPTSRLLELLYRWTVSGYIYHGYREGLRQHTRRSPSATGSGL